MDMAVGLKGLVQVSSYIPKEKLSRMKQVKRRNRRYSFSYQIEVALDEWLAKQLEATEHDPPTQAGSGRSDATV